MHNENIGVRSPLSFLNGEWINLRVTNVQERVNRLLDRLIDEGLLGSGYFPFDSPITDEMLQRMSPDEFRALYDSASTLEQKSKLLARMEVLKLPPRELLPPRERARYPVPKPVAGNETGMVDSSSTAV